MYSPSHVVHRNTASSNNPAQAKRMLPVEIGGHVSTSHFVPTLLPPHKATASTSPLAIAALFLEENTPGVSQPALGNARNQLCCVLIWNEPFQSRYAVFAERYTCLTGVTFPLTLRFGPRNGQTRLAVGANPRREEAETCDPCGVEYVYRLPVGYRPRLFTYCPCGTIGEQRRDAPVFVSFPNCSRQTTFSCRKSILCFVTGCKLRRPLLVKHHHAHQA